MRTTCLMAFLALILAGCGGSSGSAADSVGSVDNRSAETPSEGVSDASTCPQWVPDEVLPELRVEGRSIKDAYGRTVLLRGVNAGNQAKKPPHLPWEGSVFGEDGFDEDLNRFYDFGFEWGINCIRLTVFWEGIEPEKGEYSEGYVSQTMAQVEAAAQRGMYVFIDFHQDIYSRILGGSGAPYWALPDPTMEPIPLDDSLWFMKVFSDPDVMAALDHFWGNEDGVMDAYQEMAVWFAEKFADVPAVIGIDIMNEPTPGAAAKADYNGWFKDILKPFYESVGLAIREEVPRYILFVESTSLEAAGVDLGSGLPKPNLDNMVFSPHYYNTKQFLTGTYGGDIADIQEGLAVWDAVGADFDVPILLSEYGFRGYSEKGNPEEYLPDHYGVMDGLFMHGTIWSHEVTHNYWNVEDCAMVNGDWEERPDMADFVARPYPRYTSGQWLSFDYDPDTQALEFKYVTEDTGSAPTVIVLPYRHYSGEPEVSLSFGDWTYDEETRELLVFDRVCERSGAFGAEQVVKVSPGVAR